ncbi:neuropeptide receptor 15-like [Mytilus trossulus]|uniref:neuropeptide receptor 15-like n=1 Tax=Mytilus trossulus TaxID=6551 RepID=UPI003003F998
MAWQGDNNSTLLLPLNVNVPNSDNFNGNISCSKPSGNCSAASTMNGTSLNMDEPATTETLIGLSILFCQIGLVGIFGNVLVICVILLDRKMRQSVTNIFIMNLAIADLLIMLFGIPEIVQFRLNRGWLLGRVLCKINRYILVVSLYCSVLSLVSVCVERFVAIVHPIKAQIVCNRRKNILAVGVIWMISCACGIPTVLYNEVKLMIPHADISFCITIFPNHQLDNIIFKFLEFTFYYFIPVCIQIVLYAIIGRRLYASTDELHTKFQMRKELNRKTDRAAETIKARKGVVKMLVASVIVYTLCYAPPQILLFYNTLSKTRFHETWSFQVFVNIIAYVNSAANPVLYSIFSQNFRRNFKRCLFCMCIKYKHEPYIRARFNSLDSRGISRKVSTTRTTISRL